MKQLLFISAFFLLLTAKSQTISELQQKITQLEQKITVLNEKVNFCDLYNHSDVSKVKTFSSAFELKLLECKGNSIEQTVEITFTLKHSLPHQQMDLYTGREKPIAYSEVGNSFDFKSSFFPNSKSTMVETERFILPTNQLIQGKLIFRNVLPQTEKLSLVTGTFEFHNNDGYGNPGKGEFEIKNLTINWN